MDGDTLIWGYREGTGYQDETDLVGFAVEATDGKIGKVIHAGGTDSGMRYIVVDTGHWIFGKHVVLPAGAVSLIDLARSVVLVDRTRQEIKDAPELEDVIRPPEPDYLDRLSGYYGPFYSGGKV
ncbi:hypothetical protein [Streptacidiphilus neutrinimicus]|uniref:hypothetical protein n=1 Tax=Streptacidiphilus neutrinimicus TaxID=105420 RepID=UPI0005A9B238|nr:hypothetical protein [Streptacidiphilus neutrinimicus]